MRYNEYTHVDRFDLLMVEASISFTRGRNGEGIRCGFIFNILSLIMGSFKRPHFPPHHHPFPLFGTVRFEFKSKQPFTSRTTRVESMLSLCRRSNCLFFSLCQLCRYIHFFCLLLAPIYKELGQFLLRCAGEMSCLGRMNPYFTAWISHWPNDRSCPFFGVCF